MVPIYLGNYKNHKCSCVQVTLLKSILHTLSSFVSGSTTGGKKSQHTLQGINTPDKHCVYKRVYDKLMHVHSAVTARGKYKQQDKYTHEAKTGTQCHPWCGTSGLELRTLTPTWCSWFPALAYAYMQRRLQSGIADQRWTCISAFPPHTGFCPTSGFHPFPSAADDSGWQWYTVYLSGWSLFQIINEFTEFRKNIMDRLNVMTKTQLEYVTQVYTISQRGSYSDRMKRVPGVFCFALQ